jgi:hypothetical protein
MIAQAGIFNAASILRVALIYKADTIIYNLMSDVGSWDWWLT